LSFQTNSEKKDFQKIFTPVNELNAIGIRYGLKKLKIKTPLPLEQLSNTQKNFSSYSSATHERE